MKLLQKKETTPAGNQHTDMYRKIIPNGDMECIWASAGVVPYKLCDANFDCTSCAFDLVMRGGYKLNFQQMTRRGCRYSPSFFYHSGHTWAMVEENAHVRIGIDDLGQKLLGRIQEISLPEPGGLLSQDRCIAVKGRGTVVSFLTPVEGYVIKTNEKLLKEPSLINLAPYGSGWCVLLQPTRLAKNLQQLLYGTTALNWFDDETVRLYGLFIEEFDMVQPDVGVTWQDGGVLNFELLDKMRPERIKVLLEQFFS